ncbi:protein phosphatase 2C 51-like [Solanum pennellii]|uniref:Protein phosphatase 2C 51-like n=1 Tax=Solanum pennellii TaxID=28526 RepID=A0ABM1HCV9_SOLPN|nr:protein phosphatase 2C 51-like [Solanum pennellii]
MVSDPGNNKPRDVFHKRILKSYHKRQQLQQRIMTSTNSSDEDGAISAYRDQDKDYNPKKRFRPRENEPIDKSSSNSTTTNYTIECSSMGSSSTVVEIPRDNIELKYGCISMIGRRRVMEDAIKASIKMANNEFIFFGAYDGHGGSRVSHACRDRLDYVLGEELLNTKRKLMNNNDDDDDSDNSNYVDWEKVMVKCFSKIDNEVMREGSWIAAGYEEGRYEDVRKTVGSAAVVVIVGKEEIVVANCGDCRAILCSRGVAIPLSNDHKPDRPDEKKRVEAAGGKILNWNGSRVQGILATSRSIGDHCLKPFVIPEPEVTVYKRNELDEFIVIATDGLWDVVSNEVTCDVARKCLRQIRRKFPERDSAADAAALLAELAIARGSKDNISVIVVELDKMS